MENRIRVGDVMTRKFASTDPDSNILDCAKKMIKNRVGSLVLKKGEELKGIITEKDIIWALTKKPKNCDFEKITAKEVATKKVYTIKPESSLKEALQKMNKHKIRRMPVISNKYIIGYITLKDIVKFIPEIFDSNREYEKIREEYEKIQRSDFAKKGIFIESPCEECGNFDILELVDGRNLCESCKDEM
ncbi:MAG TPA: CBS domain-containing protein [Candidatus Paceibacterota bacterium]|nr:CBS domain-containing protein [Candidatus Paceibacterota bacterium]